MKPETFIVGVLVGWVFSRAHARRRFERALAEARAEVRDVLAAAEPVAGTVPAVASPMLGAAVEAAALEVTDSAQEVSGCACSA